MSQQSMVETSASNFNPKNWQQQLLNWHTKHGRENLPWKTSDKKLRPYYTLVSEIMLQQTQAGRVAEFFVPFIHEFPNIEALAKAPLQQVLAKWSGLGYYRRAENLFKAAGIIWQKLQQGDGFPQTPSELQQLPGVGKSTANAIAAQAFDKPHAILDANARRIVIRLHNLLGTTPDKKLWRISEYMTPEHSAANYCQAIMDFGSLQCSRRPKCSSCFAAEYCQANVHGTANNVTSVTTKKPKEKMPLKLILLTLNNRFLLAPNKNRGIWRGLYLPPLAQGLQEAISNAENACGISRKSWRYVARKKLVWQLTHRKMLIHTLVFDVSNSSTTSQQLVAEKNCAYSKRSNNNTSETLSFTWFAANEIQQLPLSSAMNKLLKEALNESIHSPRETKCS